MPRYFDFTSPASVGECAQRLADAVHASGSNNPSELPRALFDQRIRGKVEDDRFDLEIQFAFNQLARRLSGTLQPQPAGTRIVGECSDGPERFLLVFMRIFLFAFAAF